MENRGIVRRVDDLGRIVIPKDMRRELGISDGDPMEMLMTDEGVLIRPYPCASGIMSYLRNLKTAIMDDSYLKESDHEVMLGKLKELEHMLLDAQDKRPNM